MAGCECPDWEAAVDLQIIYWFKLGRYWGIKTDGHTTIYHCPWCGRKLENAEDTDD